MIRKITQKSLSIEKIAELRELEWVPLAPPDYIIDPDFLIDKFIEREIYYHGTITNVSNEIEMTKRNDVIWLIDNGYKSQQLIHTEITTIISISAQNIKFNKRNIPETLILRIPMEQIKSVAYVKDNLTHYICILHGIQSDRNPVPVLNLTVAATETRIKAEEICSLINQCFQIIYTEATIKHFDRHVSKLKSNESGEQKKRFESKNKTSHTKSVSKPSHEFRDEIKSLCDLDSVHSDLSSSKAYFLQNFMVQLKSVLNNDEMKRFAECLAAWQLGGPFETFCSQMQQLLGPSRICILGNMKSFIDPADWFTLEHYLNEFSPQSKSCSPLGNWSQLIGKGSLPAFHTQRSLSYASTSNGILSIYDEENSILDDFSSPIKNLHSYRRMTESNDDNEFGKAIDTLFQKVGDLELILSNHK